MQVEVKYPLEEETDSTVTVEYTWNYGDFDVESMTVNGQRIDEIGGEYQTKFPRILGDIYEIARAAAIGEIEANREHTYECEARCR